MRIYLIYLLFIFSALRASAQLAIGEWQVYNAYKDVTLVEDTPNEVFAVSNGNLYSFDKRDNSILMYDKQNGLSDTGISLIHYCGSTGQLIVIYSNSNIDIIRGGRIKNISDIKEKTFSGDKSITHCSTSDGLAYMSTAFGIVIVDLQKCEIKESFNWGTPVTCAVALDGDIYYSGPEGIRYGARSLNLSDPSNWSSVNSATASDLQVFKSKVVGIVDGKGLCYLDNSQWKLMHDNGNLHKIRLTKDDKLVSFHKWTRVYIYDSIGSYTSKYDIDYQAKDVSIYSDSGQMWIASASKALANYKISDGAVEELNYDILPTSVLSASPYHLAYSDGRIYVAGGGKRTNRYNYSGEVSIYDNGSWITFNNKEVASQAGIKFSDVVNITVNPDSPGHFYAFTWGEGMFEFRDDKFVKLYNCDNSAISSTLPNSSGRLNYNRVDGGAFDSNNNMWFTNSEVDSALMVMAPDGTMRKYFYESLKTHYNIGRIMFDSRGLLWGHVIHSGSGKGAFVIDPAKAGTSQSEQYSRYFKSFTYNDSGSDAELSLTMTSVPVEDKNGSIWIGTDNGPIVAHNPQNVFSSSYKFTRIKVPRNDGTDYADFLLSDENVRCIAVDGGNRKWMGTENGVYLISDDGLETIHHFTSDNSPLSSDVVNTIAIDELTGLVFIGTEKGLVAYQSEAIEGKDDFSNVYVYPNPVREDYYGPITITGLMGNSLVKITDINNSLIYQANSVGGQMVWDGTNYKGSRVATGVYLVYATSEDGKKGVVTKILMVR